MSPRKKKTRKTMTTQVFRSGRHIEDEPDIVGAMYNDNSKFLDKGEDVLRWGDVS
jgi:hypothetical protein